MTETPRRRRRWVFTCATLAGSVLLTLVAVEVSLRVGGAAPTVRDRGDAVFHKGTGPVFEDDPVLPFRLRPGKYTLAGAGPLTINSLGYRGPEFSLAKPKGTVRVLIVGDSFVYGYGVGDLETLPHHVGAALAERYANVEVINAGFHGSNQGHYELYLRESGFALDPDVIVVCSLADNDFAEYNHDVVAARGPDGFPSRIVDGLRADTNGRRYPRTLPRWTYRFPLLDRLAVWHRVLRAINKSRTVHKPPLTPDRLKDYFDGPLLRLRAAAQQLRIPIRHWLLVGGMTLFKKERAAPYGYMQNFFRKNKISFLDTGPLLFHRELMDLILPWDPYGHLAPAGNRLVAAAGVKDLVAVLDQTPAVRRR